MNIKFQKLQRILRDLYLLNLIEKLRYLISIPQNFNKNNKFIKRNFGFKVPPKDLAFDAYSAPDWNFYKKSGETTALFISKLCDKYLPNPNSIRILEWGCGPGRVIRHIPTSFSRNVDVYGSDYNKKTVAWCLKNLPEINFLENNLEPPIKLKKKFDFIYAISVFTHLSEKVGHKWIEELYRLTKPGGILLITTQSDSIKKFMLSDELSTYENTGLVIRGKINEGKKMYMACYSPIYLKTVLFKKFEILEHNIGCFPYIKQDFWILRKPS